VAVVTQSVRLPDQLAKRLEQMAKAARRTKSSFIVEALEDYLDRREDLEVALARFRDPGAEWLDHEQVGDELGLEAGE
jgi:predicted DNA-binding protein